MFRTDECIGISLQRLGDPREVARDPSQRNPGRSSPRTSLVPGADPELGSTPLRDVGRHGALAGRHGQIPRPS